MLYGPSIDIWVSFLLCYAMLLGFHLVLLTCDHTLKMHITVVVLCYAAKAVSEYKNLQSRLHAIYVIIRDLLIISRTNPLFVETYGPTTYKSHFLKTEESEHILCTYTVITYVKYGADEEWFLPHT